MAVAMTAATTMPSSTEMLAMKPRAYLAISMIDSSDTAAMAMCGNCAYLGLGTVPTRLRPAGMGGTVAAAALAPAAGCTAAPASALTVASHCACSGFTIWGAVGPTGTPKIELMPTRIRLMPMTAMMVPVTTGGKKRSMRLTTGASNIEMRPAPMMAPKNNPAPSTPGGALAMATMGATAAKVTPLMTGSLMPNHWVAPKAWIRVTRPQQNRSAWISIVTCSGLSLKAQPIIKCTATAPAYITSTC